MTLYKLKLALNGNLLWPGWDETHSKLKMLLLVLSIVRWSKLFIDELPWAQNYYVRWNWKLKQFIIHNQINKYFTVVKTIWKQV
jgi:hypothetical protein